MPDRLALSGRECVVEPFSSAMCDRGTQGCEREHCNCLVPYYEGVGNHSGNCGIFTADEARENREAHRA